MKITITPKDITRNKISNSDSGQVIDELAYSSKHWTSDELWENNFDYEPSEPYNFDYEQDLLENTRTSNQLYELSYLLKVSLNANWERLAREQVLQAGACVAFNNTEQWAELLEAYTQSLKDNFTESISPQYNSQLELEKTSFHDDLYREWLNGGQGRDSNGVVYEVSKYFTENTEGTYNNKLDEYTFTLEESDIENAKDNGYNKNQLKAWLLSNIIESGNARKSKDKADNEKRRAERVRLAEYNKARAEQEDNERRAKLLTLVA